MGQNHVIEAASPWLCRHLAKAKEQLMEIANRCAGSCEKYDKLEQAAMTLCIDSRSVSLTDEDLYLAAGDTPDAQARRCR
jgi:hypothetical protein